MEKYSTAARGYSEIYEQFRTAFDPHKDAVALPDLETTITMHSFTSDGRSILPGLEVYECEHHGTVFNKEEPHHIDDNTLPLHAPDWSIENNIHFSYPIIAGRDASNGVIIMLHGLNEKKWDKYLPWAYKLASLTNKKVILFPIAFHMNRAPEEWSDKKLMQMTADMRQHDNVNTSFVNAAISSRIEQNPQRFFWSGLQTFMDIHKLFKNIRGGEITSINKDAAIDFFGYSIGAFFSTILFMANPDDLLAESRLFAFCGGTTMDRMYPSSRYILDYNASLALHDFFAKKINNDFADEERLLHYLGDQHTGEGYFKTMLLYHHYIDERETRLKEIQNRVKAVSLKKDTVIPPVEILNALNGRYRDIQIPVEVLDFDYPYSHIAPFVAMPKYDKQVTAAFDEVMGRAAMFLN
jgi:hypothetical protein